MPYFDRIRQLAAARGTPARPRVWGLEVEELRLAAAAPSVPARRTAPPPAAASDVQATAPPRVEAAAAPRVAPRHAYAHQRPACRHADTA